MKILKAFVVTTFVMIFALQLQAKSVAKYGYNLDITFGGIGDMAGRFTTPTGTIKDCAFASQFAQTLEIIKKENSVTVVLNSIAPFLDAFKENILKIAAKLKPELNTKQALLLSQRIDFMLTYVYNHRLMDNLNANSLFSVRLATDPSINAAWLKKINAIKLELVIFLTGKTKDERDDLLLAITSKAEAESKSFLL